MKQIIFIAIVSLITFLLPAPTLAACSCAPNADYGDLANKSEWCSCAASCNDVGSLEKGNCPQINDQPFACKLDCNKCPATTTCGNKSYVNCDYATKCKSATDTYSCYSSENAHCRYDSYPCGVCGAGAGGGNGPSQGPAKGSSCEYKILDENGQDVTNGPIFENGKYVFQITMTNQGQRGWDQSVKLQALDTTSQVWNTQSTYPLPKSQVGVGDGVVFNIDAKAQALPAAKNFENRSLAFSMADSQGPFGAACNPQIIQVQKQTASAAPTASAGPPITTLCYVLSENPSDLDSVTSCNFTNAFTHPFTDNPTTYILKNTSSGEKTIYVKFFDNNNKPSNNGIPFAKKFIFSPDPTIANIDCHFSANGVGTDVIVTGDNFNATQGKGKLTINGQNIQPQAWSKTSITAAIDSQLQGNVPLIVTTDDGRSVNGQCVVNTTAVSFSLAIGCRTPGQFSTDNVDVKIYDQGLEPISRQKISIDKDGNASFSPKLEKRNKNKPYTMIVKAPGTLAKKVTIDTSNGGTVNLDKISLPVGDIAPKEAPDGVVNALDGAELKREWVLTQDVSNVPADFNKDLRVNSLDYSCFVKNINSADEIFTAPPAAASSPTPAPSATPQVRNLKISGRVFFDTNSDGNLTAGEQSVGGALIKLLQIPDNHVLGQALTAQELAASNLLGQQTTNLDGSYSLNTTAPSSILKMSLVIDPSSNTAKGGQKDIGIGAFPLNFEQFIIDIPISP